MPWLSVCLRVYELCCCVFPDKRSRPRGLVFPSRTALAAHACSLLLAAAIQGPQARRSRERLETAQVIKLFQLETERLLLINKLKALSFPLLARVSRRVPRGEWSLQTPVFQPTVPGDRGLPHLKPPGSRPHRFFYATTYNWSLVQKALRQQVLQGFPANRLPGLFQKSALKQ